MSEQISANIGQHTEESLVSIVIPVYNGSDYVGEAIESALAQTYPSIEVVVVNDGSKDDGATARACQAFGDRIRYFEKPNGGVASALNLAIREARGQYIAWLSHDDVFTPTKTESQMRLSSDADIVYSRFTRVNENGSELPPEDQVAQDLFHMPLEYQILAGYSLNGCTMLIDRKVFSSIGWFDETLRSTQDYDYWFRCITRGIRFSFADESVLFSRIHENQGTNLIPNHFHEASQMYESFIDMSLKRGLMNEISSKQHRELVVSLCYRGFYRPALRLVLGMKAFPWTLFDLLGILFKNRVLPRFGRLWKTQS